MLTVSLDHLPLGIRPNSNAHYYVRAKQAKLAAEATVAVLPPPPAEPLDGVTVIYQFWLPDRRVRDIDNLCHQAKPHLDAIVRSGWLRDDRWPCVRRLVAVADIRPGRPGMSIYIREDD